MSNSTVDPDAWRNLRQRIEDLVVSGRTDAVEVLLTEQLDLRSQGQLLIDCIYAEFCIRVERGQAPQPAEYLTRFPDLAVALSKRFEVHCASTVLPENSCGAVEEFGTALGNLAVQGTLSDPSKSRRIGPYKLLQLIGEGGMGAVYMADQLEPVRRRVALKLIKSGMGSKQVIARFEAERQALAMMDHQHIAKVLDAGIAEDGTPYFAMELVQGMPITKYCDREKLSIPNRMKLFVQVCRALQHAHQKGVIHRDIKPSNVLVTQRDGVPVAKVIDFGLAKALQTENRLTDKTLFTEIGQVCGTLEYMSPEQAEMNELGLDTRTDVYSLGVLLYELLTGSTPLGHDRVIRAAVHRVLELIITEDAPRPSRRLSESGEAITGISAQRRIEPSHLSGILKRELDWIALKALEKDRNRRYDSAGSLADDVQHYLDGDLVTARPPSTGYRLRKAIRKHKAAFVSGTVFVLLLLAGLIGTGSMWLKAQQSAENAQQEARRAREAESAAKLEKVRSQIAETTAHKAEITAYNSDMRQATNDWEVGKTGHLVEILDKYRKREDLKGYEWSYWDRRVHSDASALTFGGHLAAVESVDFSPYGDRLVTASADKTAKIWNAETGQHLLTLVGHSDAVEMAVFSPDGQRIVTGSGDNTVKLWDAETGQELRTFEGHTLWVSEVGFSPNGQQIVSGSADKTIKLWDVATGDEVRTLTGHSYGVYCVSFSPDGRRIVSGGGKSNNQSEMYVWDLASGQKSFTLIGHTGTVDSASFSPDGKWIVSGSRDQTAKLWNAETGQEILALKGHTGGVMSVRFSPDNKRIVTGSGDKTLKVWETETGQEMLTLNGHTQAILGVGFSPDSKRIVSGSSDQTVKVWDARPLNSDEQSGRRWARITAHLRPEIDRLTQSIESSPGDAELLKQRGLVYAQTEQWNLADADFNRAIELQPSDNELWYSEAALQLQTNHREKYDNYCKEMLARFSDSGNSFSVCGQTAKICLLVPDPVVSELLTQNAVRVASEIPAIVGLSPAYCQARGIVLYRAGRFSEAIPWLQGAEARANSAQYAEVRALALLFEAMANFQLQHEEVARDTLEKANEIINSVLLKPASGDLGSDRAGVASHMRGLELIMIRTVQREAKKVLSSAAAPIESTFSQQFQEAYQVETIVRAAWEDKSTKDEVLERIRGDQTISNVVRQRAMQRAQIFDPTPNELDVMSLTDVWERGNQYKKYDPQKALDAYFSALREPTGIADEVQIGRKLWLLHYIEENASRIQVDESEKQWLISGLPSDIDVANPVINVSFNATFSNTAAQLPTINFQCINFEANGEAGVTRASFSPRWIAKLESYFDWTQTDVQKFNGVDKSLQKTGWSLVKKHEYSSDGVEHLVGLWHRTDDVANAWNTAYSLNDQVWKTVVAPNSSISEAVLNQFSAACKQFPSGMFLNTFGVAQYRSGNYQEAISACAESLTKTPEEIGLPGPHPADLAVLAMSHFKLGNHEQATQFREQLNETIKLDAFKKDSESRQFLKEVDEMFGSGESAEKVEKESKEPSNAP